MARRAYTSRVPTSTSILHAAREKPAAGRAPTLQVLHTLRGLVQAGARVRLLTPWPEALWRRRCEELTGLTLLPEVAIESIGPGPDLPLLARWWPAQVWSGIEARLRRRLHEVQSQEPSTVVYTRARRIAAGIDPARRPPLVFEVHTLRGQDPIEHRGLERADAIVALTAALAADLPAAVARAKPVHVVPDGFAPELFALSPAERSPLPGRFVYVGSLGAWKGLELLLDALGRVPGASLDICGGSLRSPEGRRLLAGVAARGLAERVSCHGTLPQPGLRAHLARAVAGVLPLDGSHAIAARHTSPLKLFEYLGAGLPVVATDLPSVRDVIAHEREGLLFRDGDAESLAAALRRLLADTALAARLSRQSAATAASYTWERRGRRILEVCAAVISARRPSCP
jgi:glycosyltransferase involved in cell wall biosynthesis